MVDHGGGIEARKDLPQYKAKLSCKLGLNPLEALPVELAAFATAARDAPRHIQVERDSISEMEPKSESPKAEGNVQGR